MTLITSPLPDVELSAKVGNQENYTVKICLFVFNSSFFFSYWPLRWLKHSIGCNLKDWPEGIFLYPRHMLWRLWTDSASLNCSFALWYCMYMVLLTLLWQQFISNFKAYMMLSSRITFPIVIQTGTGWVFTRSSQIIRDHQRVMDC